MFGGTSPFWDGLSSCVITVEDFVGDMPCVGDHIKRQRDHIIHEAADGDGGIVWGDAPEPDDTLPAGRIWIDRMVFNSIDLTWDLYVDFYNLRNL
jgi:hypothetical protein